MLARLRRLRGDEGWMWVTAIILIPAAVVGIFFGTALIYIAIKI